MRGMLSRWAKKIVLAGLLFGQIISPFGGVAMAASSLDADDGLIYNSARNVRYAYSNPDCQFDATDTVFGPYLEQLCNYNNGGGLFSDVDFTKKVTPVAGNSKQVDIELEARGPIYEYVVPVNAYVVVVFDRSNSMAGTKIEEARNAVVNTFNQAFLDEMKLNKNITMNLAVVNFGLGAEVTRTFTQNPIQGSELLPTNSQQYTNLQGGIAEGYQLLNSVTDPDAYKYMVVLTDGVPTACRAASTSSDCFATQATAQDATINRTTSATNPAETFYESAKTIAAENRANGANVTVIPVAYDIANPVGCVTTACLARDTARDTLTSISTYDETGGTNYGFIDAAVGGDQLVEALRKAATRTGTVKAGDNAMAYDRIGDAFNYVETISGAVTASGRSVTCDLGLITELGTSCKFRVELNFNDNVCRYENSVSEWFNTNNWTYDNYNGTRLTYDPIVPAGEPQPATQQIGIVSNPQYKYTFAEADFVGCHPGQIDIAKTVEDEQGNLIPGNESFTANVKIVTDNSAESIYPYSYRLNTTGAWIPYTSAGINVTITNGQITTIYLNEIVLGSAEGYKAIVTEQAPGQTDYYCYQMQCTSHSSVIDNDSAVDHTVRNIYAPPVPGEFTITKTVVNDAISDHFNKSFDPNQTFTFDIDVVCKTNLMYGATCPTNIPTSVELSGGEHYTYSNNDWRAIESVTVTEDISGLPSEYSFLSQDADNNFFNLYTYDPVKGAISITKDTLSNPLHSGLIDPFQTFEFEIKVDSNPGSIVYYRTSANGTFEEAINGVIRVKLLAGQTMTIEFEDISDITGIDVVEIDNPTDAWHLSNTDLQSGRTLGDGDAWTFTNTFVPTCVTHPDMDGCAPTTPHTGMGMPATQESNRSMAPLALTAILVAAGVAVYTARRLSAEKK